jgi:hypothetical protein
MWDFTIQGACRNSNEILEKSLINNQLLDELLETQLNCFLL